MRELPLEGWAGRCTTLHAWMRVFVSRISIAVIAWPKMWLRWMGLGTAIASGVAYCVCGVRVIRGGILDKTESGGAASSAQLSRRIPRLQGTRQSADSVCALTHEARTLRSTTWVIYLPIVRAVGYPDTVSGNRRRGNRSCPVAKGASDLFAPESHSQLAG